MQLMIGKWIRICLLASSALASSIAALPLPIASATMQSDKLPPVEPAVAEEQAGAQAATPLPVHPLQDWVAVDQHILQQMRGGFTAPSGLHFTFGIERAVSLNGELLAMTRLEFQESGQLQFSQNGAAQAGNDIQHLQQGAGGFILPGSLPELAAATVIQNSLNGQAIQSITIINATSNSLQIVRNLHLHSVLQEAMMHPAVVR